MLFRSVAEGGYRLGLLSGIDLAYTDLWHRLAGQRYEAKHVALVEVDEASLAKNEDPLVFWAPQYAKALATLHKAGVTVVGVDFLFSITPETWLRKYRLSNAEGLKHYDLAFRQQLNAGKTVLAGAVSRGGQNQNDGFLLPHTDYLLSLPNTDVTSYIGLADLEVDDDGGTRRYAIAPRFRLDAQTAKGAPRLTLGALLAVHATQQKAAASEWRFGGKRFDSQSIDNISFAGPPGAIPRVSFHKLLEPDALQKPEVQALRGKVVVIGGTYEGTNDTHGTPYSTGVWANKKNFMPGPEVQANIVETLLSGKHTGATPAWLRLVMFGLLLIPALLLFRLLHPLFAIVALGLAILGSLGAGYLLFQRDWLFPAAHLQLGLAAGLALMLGVRLTREEREKARVREIFNEYVSQEMVELFLASGEKLDLGGKSMNISVLFSDIRNFTTISEKLSAHETVEFLNTYFPRVIAVIKDEGGRIDKFIGDAVMAEFAVPYPYTDHAARALRAAAKMRDIAEEFKVWMRKRFPGRGLPEFGIGIGVHSGSAVVGNIGSAQRKEFTAIGDTVNVASRLEGETKTLSCVIVASAETVREAGGSVTTGRHDTLKVKGRAEPVEVYEIVDVTP